jgi:hypothetical protein
MIYKIYPKDVKSNMIDVEPPMKKEDFITLLNANDKIINTVDLPHQCNLFIKQQGAGNGKTYGIIQMLDSQDFEHYKYFVIVTKQHSAKYIIYKELMEQIKDKKLKYISDIGGDIENFENIDKGDGKCEGFSGFLCRAAGQKSFTDTIKCEAKCRRQGISRKR